jgi:hypothetical protein
LLLHGLPQASLSDFGKLFTLSETSASICVSTVSIVCIQHVGRPPIEAWRGLARIGFRTANVADGADGIFLGRANPDHPIPSSAFTTKVYIDAHGSKERLGTT